MNSNLEQIKEILYNDIKEFKNDIIKLVNDNEYKIKLEETFNNISHVKILLFIYLVNENNMNNQILEFMEKFKIENNNYNYSILSNHYKHFIDIKNCLL